MTNVNGFLHNLITFLDKVPAMDDKDNRNMLLLKLPDSPAKSIKRVSDNKLADLSNIVHAVHLWGQINSGEFALKILMENSRRFIEGLLKQQNELNNLIDEYQNLYYEKIQIPIVICSMTREEARELKKQIDSNETPNEFLGFQQLRIHFECLAEFTNHYDEKRDNWTPFLHENKTVEQIIEQAINVYSKNSNQNNNLPAIEAIFLSDQCFGNDRVQRLNTWNQLRYSGGILIVDSISLFCPKIKKSLIDEAQIIANKNITIFVISPINVSTFESRQSFEEEIENHMIAVSSRFKKHDQHCEIGIINLFDLERRLYSIFPQTSKNINNHKLENNKEQLRNMIPEVDRERRKGASIYDRIYKGNS